MSDFITALIKQRNDAKRAENASNNERLKEILAILKKYDYDNGFTPEIVVGILQDLGPTFVKIGQIASQQSEHIPPEYCEALAGLRSKVAPMDLETIYAQIEKHLGKPVDELFISFKEKPLGSASVGQVHKAQLPDGTTVAVKVRRPGVVDTVARDFALIEKVLDLLIKEDAGGLDIKAFIKELEHTSKMELDFTNEARNIDIFYENNANRDGVTSPKCYRDYTCDAILTEDFVNGHEVGNIAYLDTLDNDTRDFIAELVANNFAAQVLVDGFYHADPHSGNVLIQEFATNASSDDDETGEAAVEAQALPYGIEWIDFGMMGTLTARDRQTLLDLVTAVVKHDAYGLKRTVMQVATPQGDVDHGAMLEMCENMCDQCNGTDFGDFDLGDLLGSILGGLQEENYKIDAFLTNLARGIVAVQGTIKTLSPRVNILNSFLNQVNLTPSLSMDSVKEIVPKLAMKAIQVIDDSAGLSTKTIETLDMLEKGQLKVSTDLKLQDKSIKALERISAYAIRALLVVALFIGSCLLCTAPTTGATLLVFTFQALGCIGYVVSLFFVFRLYGDIKKNL